jgi:hypothetical protein
MERSGYFRASWGSGHAEWLHAHVNDADISMHLAEHSPSRTLTIAAIIGEAVGTTALIIPVSTAILIARTLTKVLAGDTVDEFQIHVKDLFFLEVCIAADCASMPIARHTDILCTYLQSDVPLTMSGGTCTDLIDTSAPQLKLRMSPLRVAAVLERNKLRGMPLIPFEFASAFFA